MKKNYLTICVGLALYITGQPIFAAEVNPILTEEFNISIGAANVKGNTRIQSGFTGSIPAEIDFNKLGIDSTESSRYLKFKWRYSDNWHLDIENFELTQSGTAFLKPTEFEGVVFSGFIGLSFSANITAISTSYSIIKDANKEIGVGFGLHMTDIEASLAGAATADGVVIAGGATRKAKVTAPLPTFRAYATYAFNPKWSVELDMGYLALEINDNDGRILNTTASIEWRPHPNLGVGVGYTYFDVDLNVKDTGSTSSFNFKLDAPVIYFTGGF